MFETSSFKVTYLLGAGASAKALPTIKATITTEGISKAFRSLADKLRTDSTIDSKHKAFSTKTADDLIWLADNSDKFSSPDTFAKYLYLKHRAILPRLKNALSFFFTVEQFVHRKPDDRPLIFLTTVMQLNNIFPTNIKILNWNYDYQIQLGAEVFRQEIFTVGQGATTHTPPLIGYYPTLGYKGHTDVKETSMVHLNGIAGFYFHEGRQLVLNSFLNGKPHDMNEVIEEIDKNVGQRHNLITFAWERDTESAYYLKSRLEIAKAIISETDILVIIGYSFPFFNREIDREIFNALKAHDKFQKIFYQDPYRTGEFLKNQFELSDKVEIKSIQNAENYFIPIEL